MAGAGAIGGSLLVRLAGGAQEGFTSLDRSFEVKKPDCSFEVFVVPCASLVFAWSFANFPGTCWADKVGEAGAPLLWPPGMPLADARLLAIDDDRSRAVARVPPTSLGGCCNVSGPMMCLAMSPDAGSDTFLVELIPWALSTVSSLSEDCDFS